MAMVLECSLNFVGYGAAIKRHSRAGRKRQDALCPIHTMKSVNPEWARAFRLTGFAQDRTPSAAREWKIRQSSEAD
jgi:hypothetical protein